MHISLRFVTIHRRSTFICTLPVSPLAHSDVSCNHSLSAFVMVPGVIPSNGIKFQGTDSGMVAPLSQCRGRAWEGKNWGKPSPSKIRKSHDEPRCVDHQYGVRKWWIRSMYFRPSMLETMTRGQSVLRLLSVCRLKKKMVGRDDNSTYCAMRDVQRPNSWTWCLLPTSKLNLLALRQRCVAYDGVSGIKRGKLAPAVCRVGDEAFPRDECRVKRTYGVCKTRSDWCGCKIIYCKRRMFYASSLYFVQYVVIEHQISVGTYRVRMA
jgi:hypothetical protein